MIVVPLARFRRRPHEHPAPAPVSGAPAGARSGASGGYEAGDFGIVPRARFRRRLHEHPAPAPVTGAPAGARTLEVYGGRTEREFPARARSIGATSRSGRRGYSFIEILVVMGIIAVLAGIGIGVYALVIRKGPVFKTRAMLSKMRATAEAWQRQFKAIPPSDLNRLSTVTGIPIVVKGRVNPMNAGIESLFQCLNLPGFDATPEVSEAEVGNLDDDALDKALAKSQRPELFEYLDAWGSPLVYFVDGDYEAAEKAPPVYSGSPEPDAPPDFNPKPWRNATGGFANPGGFQLYSVGPDHLPNTDDDLKAWEGS